MKTGEGLAAAVHTEINRPFQASLLPRIDSQGDSHSPGKNGTIAGINRMEIQNQINIKKETTTLTGRGPAEMDVV